MFEQTFKNIDDILHKDAGCSSELDYVEQTSWILFLKYLDDFEKDKKTAAELSGKPHSGIISGEYKWDVWAVPKGKDGKIDHHKALTGDDLKDFVDRKLFPYLKKFKTSAESAATIEYKIGEIFSELKNKIQSGYNLREVINRIDELRFRSHAEKHEMSHLYEDKIKNMGNAGRNGGEYYTPRSLIKTIVKVVAPAIGDKVYDGAVGSAGFLCEAFEYLKNGDGKDARPCVSTTKQWETLQKNTFYGKEKKSLAYIIGTMNMILHGIEAPNIVHTNTLAENLADIQEKDRYDLILANPPFGGKERAEVQQNFPIKTGETAFLFLQHFIKILKAGGKAGVVIKDTFLSNTDNASVSLRKMLLENCNLHTMLSCPRGAFLGTGEKTVVLFFEKGAPTRKIWYYELDPGRNLGKTNPLNDDDLAEFTKLQKAFTDSPKSWSVDTKSIDKATFDLSVDNPNSHEEIKHRTPQEIMDEIVASDEKRTQVLQAIKKLLSERKVPTKAVWKEKRIGQIMKLEYGKPLDKAHRKEIGLYPVYGANGEKARSDKYYFDEPSIIVGRKGSAGEVNLTENKFWPLDVTYFVIFDEHEYDLRFLYHLLLTLDLPSLARGVKPGINRNVVYAKVVKVPPLPEQQRIVSKLDALSSETKKLETIHKQKLANLDEMKKSVLKKAFDGEL